MLSEKSYWAILIVGLGIFIFLDLIFVIPISRDIGVNLFTDAVFTIFTVLFLSLLFDLREKRSWRPAGERISQRIVDQVNQLFMLLQNLCQVPSDKGDFALTELSRMEKITLRKDIVEYLSRTSDDLRGYIECLDEISHTLHDIQVEYSRFLEAKLANSLMAIEDYCLNLAYCLRTLKMVVWGDNKEEHKYFEKAVAPLIQEAVGEIENLRKMGVKVHTLGGYHFTVRA